MTYGKKFNAVCNDDRFWFPYYVTEIDKLTNNLSIDIISECRFSRYWQTLFRLKQNWQTLKAIVENLKVHDLLAQVVFTIDKNLKMDELLAQVILIIIIEHWRRMS